MENHNSNGKATASLVLGIISFVFIFTGSYAILGMILAIIGLVLGIQANKEVGPSGSARAGVILCIIGLVLCGLTFIACALCLGALATLPFYF